MEAPALDLTTYRDAVDDLVADIGTPISPSHAELILTERLTEPEFADLLSATPDGIDQAMGKLLAEVEEFRPNTRSAAPDLGVLIRICLLAQIDASWWGAATTYHSDLDVLGAADLVDLDTLNTGFRYRRQATTLPRRAYRALERRVAPDRTPKTAGLRFTRARPEAVALLDQMSAEFARLAPRGTPPLWVTSLTRSVQHQLHLRSLGYAALLPSSHCTGYGMDIAMTWHRRHGADAALRHVLLERRDAGDVNVICEGEAWHVCISPAAVDRLREDVGIRNGG